LKYSYTNKKYVSMIYYEIINIKLSYTLDPGP